MKTMLRMLMTFMIAATAAQAQTRGGFEVGAQVLDYSLHQSVEKDDGRFSGLTAGYTKTFGSSVFVRGRLQLAFGSADVKSGDGVTVLSNVDQEVGSLELHAGRDFRLNDRTTLSPFAGLGSRVLDDNSGGKESDTAVGFDRRLGFRYVPLGVDATFALRGNATLTLSAQYNWIIDGHTEADLSDADPDLPNVRASIDGGSGYEIGAMIGLPVGRHRLNAGPFVRKWSIDPSDSDVLPGGRSKEAGLRVSFVF